jgi:acetyl-CoA carboxylase biotin carboxylase subunit
MKPLRRVFVANRGEIAVRVIRACKALGLETVLGVSEADRDSLGARLADRAVCIGPPPAALSYLRPEILVTAALRTGCQALHPGYGFLAERADLQRACAEAGLAFVGPAAEAIEAMGDKLNAIRLAQRSGLPTLAGSADPVSAASAAAAAARIGFPCLLKARAGGGGRGMRIVRCEAELPAAFESAAAEAQAAFGDATLYLERYVERARHVEVQVLGDAHGGLRHLFERDCSVQRRHQKLVEEAPAPDLPPAMRAEMIEAALALAREVRYTSAGTVEFVYDPAAGRYYFLEMNTRIQVEHPVTEVLTGVDLVREQLRIAAGERVSFRQAEIEPRGHAVECRINAEDPARAFAPSPGRVTRWEAPAGPGVRVDTHCFAGCSVPPYYDSLLAKLIVHDAHRAAALQRARAALEAFVVEGVATTIAFQRDVLGHPDFAGAKVTTRWVEETLRGATPAPRLAHESH